MDSEIGNFIIDNLEYFVICLSPLVIYGVYKMKKIERRDNDLTPLIIKLKKHQESLNKRTKSNPFG